MPAVPRTASTGAPTADAAAQPVYTDNSPIRTAEARPVIHRFATWGSGGYLGGDIIPREDRGVVSTVGATFTGRTAVDRAVAIGDQIAAATGTDPAAAASVVRQYRQRTGSFPDLTQLGNLGVSGGGGLPPEEGGLLQAGVAGGFGLNTWLILSAIGLVLFLVYGKRGR